MKLSLIICLLGVALFAADPGEDLHVAARRGQTAEVKKLLESGAPVEAKNAYGATPLFMAVFNGHTETALLLLDKGANPNVTDTFYKFSILEGALQKQKTDIIKPLIAKGATVTSRHLNMVVANGDAETLNALLTHKFTPDELTGALKAAITAKKDDMAAALRKAGAAEPKMAAISGATLESYAGEFSSANLPMGIKIKPANGGLAVQPDGQPELAFAADSPTEFTFAMANIRLVFTDKDKFTLHQGGQQFVFTRKGSAAAASTPPARAVDAKILNSYTGKYASPALPLEIEVSNIDGKLGIQATDQARIVLASETDTTFTFAPAGIRVVFTGTGKFTLFQGGKEFPYTRKD